MRCHIPGCMRATGSTTERPGRLVLACCRFALDVRTRSGSPSGIKDLHTVAADKAHTVIVMHPEVGAVVPTLCPPYAQAGCAAQPSSAEGGADQLSSSDAEGCMCRA